MSNDLNQKNSIAGAQGASGALGWRHGEERALVDGRRKDEALVVVGMVAQDLDAARRVRHRSRLPAKELLKLGDDLVIDILVQHFSPPKPEGAFCHAPMIHVLQKIQFRHLRPYGPRH